jgi:hypothetical protein
MIMSKVLTWAGASRVWRKALLFEKSSKNLFPWGVKQFAKVLWFFLSRKNCFP